MASKFTTSNSAGWLMAGPVVALLAIFTVLPFFMALIFSFTDLRLISPNAPRFVGLGNYEQLLGIGFLTIEPKRDATGAVERDAKGEHLYPPVRSFTRGNPTYPHLAGLRE